MEFSLEIFWNILTEIIIGNLAYFEFQDPYCKFNLVKFEVFLTEIKVFDTNYAKIWV